MKLNTRSGKAKEAADMWKDQYFERNDGCWGDTISGSALTTYRKLRAAKGNPDRVEAIVDGKSWTQEWCDECHGYCPVSVEFGDERSTSICVACLKKALALIRKG